MVRFRILLLLLGTLIIALGAVAVPAWTPNQNHVGVHIEQYDANRINNVIAMMDSAGAQWVRYDLRWSHVEPNDDSFNFDTMSISYELNQLDSAGKKVLLLFSTAPEWAYDDCDTSSGGAAPGWCSPDDSQYYDAFADLVYEVADEFSFVDFFEVWNEAFDESASYSSTQGLHFDGSPAELDSMIVHAAGALDDLGEGDEIVCCGYADNDTADYDFIEEHFRSIGSYIDVVSVHSYTDGTALQTPENFVSEVRSEIGSGPPIWLTEFGAAGDGVPFEDDAPILARVFYKTVNNTWNWDKSFLFTFDRRSADDYTDPLIRYNSSGNYPRPDSIEFASFCRMVAIAGNLSDVGTCISDLTLEMTVQSVPPNTNCLFSVSASDGYPENEFFQWYRSGANVTDNGEDSEYIFTPLDDFTLKVVVNGYYQESWPIDVDSAASCPQ